jgi:hypothetical protein
MRAEASTGLTRPRVQRQFESNRLAKDFQAHAYEEVLPVQRRSGTRTATAGRTEGSLAEAKPVQGEVAA